MMSQPERLTENGAAAVTWTVNAPPDLVWSVLADGWMYSTWVVGASRIREVDAGWPAQGSRIHHSVGLWPLLIDDVTQVVSLVPGRELVLRARAWPAGDASVQIFLEPRPAEHTAIRMVEDATAGPGRLVPRPLRQAAIAPRNVETLRRLGLLVMGRCRQQWG